MVDELLKTKKKVKKQEPVPNFYYQYLYKLRTKWIGYDMPVRVKYNDYYVEAYIRPTKNAKTDEEVADQKIIVDFAFLFTNRTNTVEVSLIDVYPSRRSLLRFNKDTLEVSDINTGLIDNYQIIPYKEEDTPKRLEKLLTDVFKEFEFTKEELCSLLGVENIEDKLLEQYKSDNKKYCLLTSKLSSCYIAKKKIMNIPTAHSIPELKQKYTNCTLCELGQKRAERNTQVVFGRGNESSADLFLIGEAPGAQEERDGIPFNPLAPAGSTLQAVITAAGIDPSKIWISNSVLCRPLPKEGMHGENGKPDAKSISICNTRLKNELAILKPKVVVLLGTYAYQAYFGREIENITKNTGWIPTSNMKVYLLSHPSYIARQISFAQKEPDKVVSIKKEYLNHFLEIKKELDNHGRI